MMTKAAVQRHGFTFAAAVAALIAIVAGCNGNGSGGDNGEGQNDTHEELLTAMVLTPDDLPGTFVQTDENFSTNEQVARGEEDFEAQLANLNRWGRLLGYDVTYQPENPDQGPFVGLISTVSLYKTADGASQSFANAVRAARERDWAATTTGFRDLQVEEIERPDIADEVVWIRISGIAGDDANPRFPADDRILIREERVRALVRVASMSHSLTQSDEMADEAARLAGIVVERIRSVLGPQ